VFIGTYAPKLDDKGRVILPAKFREELSAGLVITRGQDRSLYVFSQREFESMHEKLREAPVTGKQGRDFSRLFLSGASQESLDSQNRLTIPANLREYAALERDLTVIGMGARVEIWDSTGWDAFYASTESEFSNAAEGVIPGLF
jgi:MraZ protein